MTDSRPCADGESTVRARIAQLLDEGTSGVEYGAETKAFSPEIDAPGDGVVVVTGEIHRQQSVIIACDGAAAGGSHGVFGHAKTERALGLAAHLGAPVFLLLEGGGYRAFDLPYYMERRDLVDELAKLSGRVPLIGIARGHVSDIRALMLGVCDLVVAVSGSTVSLHEPGSPLNEGEPDDTLLMERSGAVDIVVDNDRSAARTAREYLHLMTAPRVPYTAVDDPATKAALRQIVPENPRRAIDGRRVIELVVDPGSALSLRQRFGGSIQTALGRIDGRAVGVVASHSMVGAGAIDSNASDKLARFTTLCDVYGLPIVQLTDVPGLLAGPQAESTAMIRHSTRPFFRQTYARVPHLSVVLRRAFGQGMVVMGLGGHISGRALQVVWPSAQFGGMGLGGAAAITASTAAATGQSRSEHEVAERLAEYGAADGLAARFQIDDVIDPGETRERLIATIRQLPLLDSPRQPIQHIDAW